MDHDLSVPVECGLVRRLLDGDFAVTAEITPPVSGSADALLAKVEPLRGRVDAINLTDGASARVHMSSLAAAAILVRHGMEPILQMTCRDRNRIALMGDLLGASALGVKSVLILTGDDPASGDQPDAKPVFDLKSEELLRIASQMSNEGKIPSTGLRRLDGGVAPSTRPIDAPPRFFLGAADTPTGERDDRWIATLRRKIRAGAQFLQTQLCYDLERLRRYAELLRDEGLSDHLFVLIGNGPLASARSALWMREHLWGVQIPDAIVERLDRAHDPKAEGVAICADQIREIAELPGIAGIHLMAPINTECIPLAIDAAGLKRRAAPPDGEPD